LILLPSKNIDVSVAGNMTINLISTNLKAGLIFFLTIIFRPRKVWPEFYGVGIETVANLIAPNGNPEGEIPFKECIITNNYLFEELAPFGIFSETEDS
jgi:hypothetical protein